MMKFGSTESKIGALITVISPERLSEVQEAIGFSLGFDSLLY